MQENPDTAIPFSFFVSLLDEIARISPRKSNQTARSKYKDVALRTLNNWIAELHSRFSPLPPDTTAVFFRLFFPEEDVQRKYGIQEKKLSDYLRDIFSPGTKGTTCEWDRVLQAQQDATCFGETVVKALRFMSMTSEDSLSMHEVDALLTELASTCAFSSSTIRHSTTNSSTKRTPRAILTLLYTFLSPSSSGYLTQIILKDLRPILYPISETHYTASLLQYNSRSVSMLSKEDVMKAWDASGRMLRMYRVRASLEDAASAFESEGGSGSWDVTPQIGVPVQIPKCLKARGCADTIKHLRGSTKLWVETKYDGERAQIHVEVDERGKSRITIFSKSRRDSTMDRFGVHHIIRQVLGLAENDENDKGVGCAPRIKKNVILEAEMVAFSEALNKVDEFWRIRSLIASTARGVRHRPPPKPRSNPALDSDSDSEYGDDDEHEAASQASLLSTTAPSTTHHLALIFFDILLLDSRSLFQHTYAQRRSILEELLAPGLKDGYAMLAERTCVDVCAEHGGVEKLERVFAGLMSRHEEGAVVKAEEGVYGAPWGLSRWVKLKADYIPGYWDTVDLALLGAGWDKDRAAELRVSSSVYTTFYFGALANPEDLLTNPDAKPHFKGIFTSSYGLNREQLEELNFLIRSSDPIACESNKKRPLPEMHYTLDMPHHLKRPLVLLQKPLLAELFGAGFTKSPGCTFYELRFPRITKFYPRSSRPCFFSAPSSSTSASTTTCTSSNCLSYASLQLIARESVGKDRSGKSEEDWCKQLWGKPVSPCVSASPKRRKREEEWVGRLRVVDGLTGKEEVRAVKRVKRGDDKSKSGMGGENVDEVRGERRVDGPVVGAKLRAFGSMTNVFAGSHASRSDQLTPNRVVASARHSVIARSPLAVTAIDVAQPLEQNIPIKIESTTTSGVEESYPNSTSGSPCKDSTKPSNELALPTPPLSSPISTPPLSSPNTLKYAHTPLAKFLSTAVVCLFRSTNSPRPSWRVPSSEIIPLANRLNSFDAFLLACGLSDSQSVSAACGWAERGVLFVDEEESARVDATIKRLVERRAAVLRHADVEKAGRKCVKPIFVFGLKMLGKEEVEKEGDVEARAICRLR
ncbi:hypothetical protein BC629DRAFT_1682669 [Irpex lacteus]|nr:hypothetical protein BC629DRAFT_1682669 [Irpex lacteus]